MPEYDNNLRGVLFQNKKTKETQPDYKGSCEIDGLEYWVSGWKKLSKDNKPFLSLSFQVKTDRTGKNSNAWKAVEDKFKKPVENTPDNYDEPINLDDIPF